MIADNTHQPPADPWPEFAPGYVPPKVDGAVPLHSIGALAGTDGSWVRTVWTGGALGATVNVRWHPADGAVGRFEVWANSTGKVGVNGDYRAADPQTACELGGLIALAIFVAHRLKNGETPECVLLHRPCEVTVPNLDSDPELNPEGQPCPK